MTYRNIIDARFAQTVVVSASNIVSSSLVALLVFSAVNAEEKNPNDYRKISEMGLSNRDVGFDGGYIGFTGGADLVKSKVNTNATANNNATLSNNSDLSIRGASGGVVAGWGKTVKEIFLRAEVAAELSNASGDSAINVNDNSTNSARITAKKQNSLSIAAHIGKAIDNKTLIYGKAGVASNGYRFSSSVLNMDVGVTRTASASKNVRLLQPILGVGVERKVARVSHVDLHMGAEYEHTFGKATQVNLSSSTIVSGASTFDTSADAIKARILFKF